MIRRVFITFILLLSLVPVAWGGNTSRDFGGVGIDGVPRSDGTILVRQLVTGGPAHRAGIRPGDVITRIDGKATFGSDFKEMVEHRLRGRAGTSVLIQVRRPGETKSLTFSLMRRQLEIPASGKKSNKKGE
ncbi:hypothetical protein GMLC_42630 [Geomonas limicola]|uniref:PDZ domain-containing protein n=1 Tax=Geomonas limicola TaxID=2740186 RepID=A0A6V8NFZ5_9BACT|nr:PDZ domain-containing protein [Geomonas limicola]GFO70684.1 hypothetical protein GMLC_42630 [Geomonas limicola]